MTAEGTPHGSVFGASGSIARLVVERLFIVPGVDHVDLYDRMDGIPFDELAAFFDGNLK